MAEDIGKHLIVEKSGKIAKVTLNRPERLNALTNAHWDQLARAWQQLDEDPEVWVIIITGAGEKAFCTGQDLKEISAHGSDRWADTYSVDTPVRPQAIYEQLTGTPAIAAINGYCVAGGLEIALSCDIRVAVDYAEFGLQEVRWGIIPGGGGVDKLPRAMPMGIALELLLTGQRISAQQAHQYGLVNHVVSKEELMHKAEAIAQKICENGPLAVRTIKEQVYRCYNLTMPQAFLFEHAFGRILDQTEDAVEGPTAFAEKRTPQFKRQ